MFDYYSYVNDLKEDKLINEIEKINKRLFKTSPTSPVYNQLLSMLNMAQDAYHDALARHMIKNETEVINIGEIESTVLEPEYSNEELLNIIVTEYSSKKADKE